MTVRFRNAHELADESNDEIRTEREMVWNQMRYVMRVAHDNGRQMSADESREYDALERILDSIDNMARMREVDRTGVIAPDSSAEDYHEGQPLMKDQTFVGFAQAMGHEDEPEDVSLAKYLKGAFTGDWRDAEQERILNVQSGASAGAGGVMLPTVLTSRIIDMARAKTRVLEAGATVVPMANRTVDVARWLTDPTPAFRAENAAIAESDATLDKITLAAKSLAVVTKASRELVEDTDISSQLESAFASAFALKIDWAALYADGTGNAPTGVKSTAAVTKTPLATNGATPTWAALVNSVGRLRDVNEDPTAQIMADRTARTLSLLVGSDGQYVKAPDYLDGIKRLSTSQVPLNLTVGTSADTSDVFTADWAQLYLGVRTQLQITLLTERYMPDAGQYGFVAWWRGDVAVARPKAFDVVTGVRP